MLQRPDISSGNLPQTALAVHCCEKTYGGQPELAVRRVLFRRQHKNLSDEEFRWLIRILKKSKKMGTPISQRKKR